jgi:hypothetical protein
LFCTVSLNAGRRARDAGLRIKRECIVNGGGEATVAAGRDKSRQVGGCHALMITRPPLHWPDVSPSTSTTTITDPRMQSIYYDKLLVGDAK